MDKKTNISLIGMPGCGKSTIGVVLAKALNMRFTDTDLLIQTDQNRYLWEIIQQDGLDEFLRIESKAVSSLSGENTLFATGGSVVYSPAAMERLREISQVFYLKLPYRTIERRIKDIKGRGVVMDRGQTLLDLYTQRGPLYEKYCHQIIDAEGKSVEDVVELVITALGRPKRTAPAGREMKHKMKNTRIGGAHDQR